jgi:hypothetical protein
VPPSGTKDLNRNVLVHLMQIREYHDSDRTALRQIHAAQNFPYAFPDLSNPLFLTKIVLTDGQESVGPGAPATPSGAEHEPRNTARGKLLGAAFLRLTAEAYLLLDPQLKNPRDRWNAILALHAAAQNDAQLRGLEDVHAWLPPAIAQKFGRRLAKLGWRRDDAWAPFCKRFYD